VSTDRIYHEAIMSLANVATGDGTLAAPDGRAFIDNPLCGDCVEMQVSLADGCIAALAHQVKGCLLCRAAASVIGKRAVGARLEEVEKISAGVSAMLELQESPPAGWQELTAFAPVHGHRSRYDCVRLPFRALLAALRVAGEQR
jgi:NifU-like protein involved in Fe-S cluster formation